MKRDVMVAAILFSLALPALTGCNLSTTPDPSTLPAQGPPQVLILAPQANQTVLEGVTVPLQAQVLNAGADLARVDFAVDGEIFSSREQPNSEAAELFNISESWVSAGTGARNLSVVAVRSDESASEPGRVTVMVIGQAQAEVPTEVPPRSEEVASSEGEQQQEQAAEQEAQPAEQAPVDNTPRARIVRGANVRSGPDTRFAPPIGSIAAGEVTDLLAINTHGTWYKIKYYNGVGWVFGSLVEASGDLANLPVESGPRLPPPTAVPPTGEPQPVYGNDINLFAGKLHSHKEGSKFICNVAFQLSLDVANFGSSPSPGGTVLFRRHADEAASGSGHNRLEEATIGTATFPPVAPGETVGTERIAVSISTNFKERHTITAIVNPEGVIPETNRNDNTQTTIFILEQGGC